MSNVTPQAIQDAEQQMQAVLTRSATDLEFRSLLLSDSRTALGQHFGREFPESFNVAFVENAGTATLVLPQAYDPNAELSENELEAVAGGVIPVAIYYIGAAILAAAAGDAMFDT